MAKKLYKEVIIMEYWKEVLAEITTYLNNIDILKNIEFWKNISGFIQAFATSIAIFFGGVWTYLLFVRQRLHYPKVNIKLSAVDELIPNGYRIVHVEIKIDNVGSVILRSNAAELRIRQVLPIPDDIKETVNMGKDPVNEGNTEIVWPMLFGRDWKWGKSGFEIEPSESDSLHADYIIEDNIKVVEFYCFISNAKKKRRRLGWTLTQLHNFYKEGETMTKKSNKKGLVNNQQERQQKQQQQQKPQKPVKPKKADKKD